MFCIIYDTNSRNFKRLTAGVGLDYSPDLQENESFILKDSVPQVLNQNWTVDEDGNLQPPPPPSPPTEEELFAIKTRQYEVAIQRWLDKTARQYKYDNITSACSYAGYDNPFKEEACDFVAWRGDVWRYCYTELEKIKNGEREEPESPQWFIENELPQFSHPYTPIDWGNQ